MRLNIHSFNLEVRNCHLQIGIWDVWTRKWKEMTSLVLFYIFWLSRKSWLSCILASSREACNTQKGRTWAFVNKPFWDISVNHFGFTSTSTLILVTLNTTNHMDIQVRYNPSMQKLSSSIYHSQGLFEHPKCSCSTIQHDVFGNKTNAYMEISDFWNPPVIDS